MTVKQIRFSEEIKDSHHEPPASFWPLLEDSCGKDHWCLDIGTGSGRVAFYLADKVRWVLGLDVRSKPIEEARRKAQNEGVINVQFMVANVERTMLAEMSPVGEFQLVSSNLYLSREALALLSDAVAEEGYLCCTCFSDMHWHETGEEMAHSFSVESLRQALEENGFRIDTLEEYTSEIQFDDLEEVEHYLPARILSSWKENGRWSHLAGRFAKGNKQLTDGRIVFRAGK